MKSPDSDEYFRPKTYLGYVVTRMRRGEVWRTLAAIYSKIRKYTFISSLIRTFGLIITLLEKSAVLLLLVTVILFTFPVIIAAFIVYALVCVSKYFIIRKSISAWLSDAEKITVFITKSSIFSNSAENLFMRHAKYEASLFTHPVIVLCKDRFIAAKWYSLNLLAIKPDYYFFLRRSQLDKNRAKITVIVLE